MSALSDFWFATQLVAASSLFVILTFWLSHRVAVYERMQPMAVDSETTAEFRLLAASLFVEVLLGFFYEFSNPYVRFLLFVSATWLSFCALTIHGLKWYRTLANQWDKALECFAGNLAGQREVAHRSADGLLWFVFLAYEVVKRLRDFRNIPRHPCLCGARRPDGRPLTMRECCWNKKLERRH